VRGRIERRLDALPGSLAAALAGALLIVDDVHLLGTGADALIDELTRASAPGGMILILSEEHLPLRQGGREMLLGPLTVEVPQARGVEFYPSALEKGVRSERALKLAQLVNSNVVRATLDADPE